MAAILNRLSSLVTTGVEVVSTAVDFNRSTLSGSLDIVAVRHTDSTIVSTPFHVRIGKWQLLGAGDKHKLVAVYVNGAKTALVMQLGEDGQAFFTIPRPALRSSPATLSPTVEAAAAAMSPIAAAAAAAAAADSSLGGLVLPPAAAATAPPPAAGTVGATAEEGGRWTWLWGRRPRAAAGATTAASTIAALAQVSPAVMPAEALVAVDVDAAGLTPLPASPVRDLTASGGAASPRLGAAVVRLTTVVAAGGGDGGSDGAAAAPALHAVAGGGAGARSARSRRGSKASAARLSRSGRSERSGEALDDSWHERVARQVALVRARRMSDGDLARHRHEAVGGSGGHSDIGWSHADVDLALSQWDRYSAGDAEDLAQDRLLRDELRVVAGSPRQGETAATGAGDEPWSFGDVHVDVAAGVDPLPGAAALPSAPAAATAAAAAGAGRQDQWAPAAAQGRSGFAALLEARHRGGGSALALDAAFPSGISLASMASRASRASFAGFHTPMSHLSAARLSPSAVAAGQPLDGSDDGTHAAAPASVGYSAERSGGAGAVAATAVALHPHRARRHRRARPATRSVSSRSSSGSAPDRRHAALALPLPLPRGDAAAGVAAAPGTADSGPSFTDELLASATGRGTLNVEWTASAAEERATRRAMAREERRQQWRRMPSQLPQLTPKGSFGAPLPEAAATDKPLRRAAKHVIAEVGGAALHAASTAVGGVAATMHALTSAAHGDSGGGAAPFDEASPVAGGDHVPPASAIDISPAPTSASHAAAAALPALSAPPSDDAIAIPVVPVKAVGDQEAMLPPSEVPHLATAVAKAVAAAGDAPAAAGIARSNSGRKSRRRRLPRRRPTGMFSSLFAYLRGDYYGAGEDDDDDDDDSDLEWGIRVPAAASGTGSPRADRSRANSDALERGGMRARASFSGAHSSRTAFGREGSGGGFGTSSPLATVLSSTPPGREHRSVVAAPAAASPPREAAAGGASRVLPLVATVEADVTAASGSSDAPGERASPARASTAHRHGRDASTATVSPTKAMRDSPSRFTAAGATLRRMSGLAVLPSASSVATISPSAGLASAGAGAGTSLARSPLRRVRGDGIGMAAVPDATAAHSPATASATAAAGAASEPHTALREPSLVVVVSPAAHIAAAVHERMTNDTMTPALHAEPLNRAAVADALVRHDSSGSVVIGSVRLGDVLVAAMCPHLDPSILAAAGIPSRASAAGFIAAETGGMRRRTPLFPAAAANVGDARGETASRGDAAGAGAGAGAPRIASSHGSERRRAARGHSFDVAALSRRDAAAIQLAYATWLEMRTHAGAVTVVRPSEGLDARLVMGGGDVGEGDDSPAAGPRKGSDSMRARPLHVSTGAASEASSPATLTVTPAAASTTVAVAVAGTAASSPTALDVTSGIAITSTRSLLSPSQPTPRYLGSDDMDAYIFDSNAATPAPAPAPAPALAPPRRRKRDILFGWLGFATATATATAAPPPPLQPAAVAAAGVETAALGGSAATSAAAVATTPASAAAVPAATRAASSTAGSVAPASDGESAPSRGRAGTAISVASLSSGGGGGAADGGSMLLQQPIWPGPLASTASIDDAASTASLPGSEPGGRGGRRAGGAAAGSGYDTDSSMEVVTVADGKGGASSLYRSLRPTSEQLQALNLRPGANTVTFVVDDDVHVSCTLYLLSPNTKIVVSDVDGTITKSDVWGHLSYLVGRDWTHEGVAHLYTSIASSGYTMLYLTSRAIGQSGATKGYLQNVVQPAAVVTDGGGKRGGAAASQAPPLPLSASSSTAAARRGTPAPSPTGSIAAAGLHLSPSPSPTCSTPLPIAPLTALPPMQREFHLPPGPVITSPDRLMTAFTREVLLRQPQVFKIAALQDVARLFPHGVNPFYAGFGNRDTDVVSYRAVGIPDSKIFIVNPAGEVKQVHSAYTKSYPSINALAADMFPPVADVGPEDAEVGWRYGKPLALHEAYGDVLYWRHTLAAAPHDAVKLVAPQRNILVPPPATATAAAGKGGGKGGKAAAAAGAGTVTAPRDGASKSAGMSAGSPAASAGSATAGKGTPTTAASSEGLAATALRGGAATAGGAGAGSSSRGMGRLVNGVFVMGTETAAPAHVPAPAATTTVTVAPAQGDKVRLPFTGGFGLGLMGGDVGSLARF